VAWFARGRRGEEALSVGMGRRAQDVTGGTLLHDAPVLHHRHTFGRAPHHTEVVADEQHSASAIDLAPDEVEYPVAHLGVQGSGWLVGDDEGRVGRDGRGDEGALAESTAEFAGTLGRTHLGIGDTRLCKEFEHTRPPLDGSQACVEPQRVIHLPSDKLKRIEGDKCVLADGAHNGTAKFFECAPVEPGDVPTAHPKSIGENKATRASQPNQRARGHTFARAGLTDQRQALARGDGEGDAVHGGILGAGETHPEVLDLNNGFRGHRARPLDCRLRPNRVVLAALNTIARPGKNVIHQNDEI